MCQPQHITNILRFSKGWAHDEFQVSYKLFLPQLQKHNICNLIRLQQNANNVTDQVWNNYNLSRIK